MIFSAGSRRVGCYSVSVGQRPSSWPRPRWRWWSCDDARSSTRLPASVSRRDARDTSPRDHRGRSRPDRPAIGRRSRRVSHRIVDPLIDRPRIRCDDAETIEAREGDLAAVDYHRPPSIERVCRPKNGSSEKGGREAAASVQPLKRRRPSRLFGVLPAGVWLLGAGAILRLARIARRASVISPRTALAWIRWAGVLFRTGFSTWRYNGGKWQ